MSGLFAVQGTDCRKYATITVENLQQLDHQLRQHAETS
jgi:hypothetical protein